MSESTENEHLNGWRSFLEGCRESASHIVPLVSSGHLTRINGLVMEASGLKLPLGSSCRILPAGGSPIEAEVVGFNGERLFLMPSEDVYGLSPGAKVVALDPTTAPPRFGHPPRPDDALLIARNYYRSATHCLAEFSMPQAGRSTNSGRCQQKPYALCKDARSTRCRVHRSKNPWMWAFVPLTHY